MSISLFINTLQSYITSIFEKILSASIIYVFINPERMVCAAKPTVIKNAVDIFGFVIIFISAKCRITICQYYIFVIIDFKIAGYS